MATQRYPNHRTTEVAKLMRSEHPRYAAGRARLIDTLRELGMCRRGPQR